MYDADDFDSMDCDDLSVLIMELQNELVAVRNENLDLREEIERLHDDLAGEDL